MSSTTKTANPPAVLATSQSGSSYGQILRSTALIGGASVIEIALRIIRTKFLAMWLGPAGVGLMALYNSILELAATVSQMGMNDSGIRQIAEAAGTGNTERISRTGRTLLRSALLFGLLGGGALALLSSPVSSVTFGNSSNSLGVAALGAAVLFSVVSGSQGALIQGMRRISDLASLRIIGALAGTVLGIGIVWVWGQAGIIPLIITLSFVSLAVSWVFVLKVRLPAVSMSWQETKTEARSLLSLGAVFVTSALMTTGVAYLTRLIVSRELGVQSVGHYTAAYTLSGLYVSFILQAMGTDFYPRLTAVSANCTDVNRLVNEQAEISILLAVPGVLATLTLAPWVISLFYSGQFEPAGEVLRWQVLGVLGRVISWPMGFILLARSRRRIFLFTEIAANLVHIGLLLCCINVWGLPGTGMAFFGMYLFYIILMMVVSRNETAFSWSPYNARILFWLLIAVFTAFVATGYSPGLPGRLIGCLLTIISSWFCARALLKRVPPRHLGFLARWAG